MNKILLITPEFPYPPFDGVKIPVWQRILGLSKFHRIDVIVNQSSFEISVEQKKVMSNLENVNFYFLKIFFSRSFFGRVFIFCFSDSPFFSTHRKNEIALKQLCQKIVENEYSHVVIDTEQFASIISDLPYGPIYISSPNDSVSLSYKDELRFNIHKNIFKRALVYLNYIRSKKFESKYYPKFNYCQLVSTIDEWHLKKINSTINTIVFPVGVTPRELIEKPNSQNRPYVLIVGRLAGGNLIYVREFIENIWQKFLLINPRYKLLLVSRIVPDDFEALYSKLNVEIKSNVDDLQLEVIYVNADFVISPVKKTAGMLNKVIEAMSFGKLVLGYKYNFLSLDYSNNGVCFIGVDSDSEFLAEMIKIVDDYERLIKMGILAKEYVENNLSWELILSNYCQFISWSYDKEYSIVHD